MAATLCNFIGKLNEEETNRQALRNLVNVNLYEETFPRNPNETLIHTWARIKISCIDDLLIEDNR